VQDIAHVINYDLPEVAENFIHRVGRTGRNGLHGVASTLFAKEQRSELFQLERTLGIKIERLRADDGQPEKPGYNMVKSHANGGHASVSRPVRTESEAPRPTMIRLPGEILQVQMES
jgi:superfamily II DNA/RNA helicase